MFCMSMSISVFADIEPLDRNQYVSSASSAPSASSTAPSKTPEDEIDPTELDEIKEVQSNTNWVDTFIFLTGIFLWIGDMIYITICTLDLVLPALGSLVLRAISFGKTDHLTEGWVKILIKFVAVAAIGTLFVGGYVKMFFAYVFGRFLAAGF
ncbi:MAG: hypothetical protein RSC43_00945 [Clostridia bacterium]